MPKVISFGDESLEVFPERCQSPRKKCQQCALEGKYPCRRVVGAQFSTSGFYVVSSIAAMLDCSVRYIWKAINAVGLKGELEWRGHHREANAEQCMQIKNWIAGRRIAVVFDESNGMLRVDDK